jgi:hypothetical protein
VGPDELVPVTARALARARWEDAANFLDDDEGVVRARRYYGEHIAGSAFERKLIQSALLVLARAGELSGASPAQPPLGLADSPDSPFAPQPHAGDPA